MSLAERRKMVDREHTIVVDEAPVCPAGSEPLWSILPAQGGLGALALMPAVDRQYLETPFYGSRRMRVWLGATGGWW